MTVDETLEPPKPASASDRALAGYKASLRTGRAVYIAVVSVIALVLTSIVLIYWANGETAHTSLRTATHPAPPIGLQPISATPTQRWRNNDHTAIGFPIWNGTVITYSTHKVVGRSVVSGKVTWSYTRTDREVCQVMVDAGVAIAVFRNGKDCDQVDAFDAESGERKWSRTLFKDGAHTLGEPTYSIGQFAVLIISPQVIYAIEPTGGLDRWVFQQPGCTINSAVIGTKGALISQTCVDPTCTGLKFCGAGPQLLLRDSATGRVDDAAKNKGNPDQVIWNNIGNTSVPVSADQLISSVQPGSRTLTTWDLKGKPVGTAELLAGAINTDDIAARSTADTEIIWIGGTVYAIKNDTGTVVWSAPTTGPATVTTSTGANDPLIQLKDSIVLAPAAGGVTSLDPNTGTQLTTYPVSSPQEGASVFPMGTAFLVTGTSTIAYR